MSRKLGRRSTDDTADLTDPQRHHLRGRHLPDPYRDVDPLFGKIDEAVDRQRSQPKFRCLSPGVYDFLAGKFGKVQVSRVACAQIKTRERSLNSSLKV